MSTLDERLRTIAAAPTLLVAADFDGTLSALAPTPDAARADPAAIEALCDFTTMPQTWIAVVSGRALAVLKQLVAPLLEPPPRRRRVTLIGSHGLEREHAADDSGPLSAPERAAFDRLRAVCHERAAHLPGALVEVKTYSVALHVRLADPVAGKQLLAEMEAIFSKEPGVTILHGILALEFFVRKASKGDAVLDLRKQLGGGPAFFVGDDLTDESVFSVLGDDDISVRVGPGLTVATFRLPEQTGVAPLLQQLARYRREYGNQAWAPLTAPPSTS